MCVCCAVYVCACVLTTTPSLRMHMHRYELYQRRSTVWRGVVQSARLAEFVAQVQDVKQYQVDLINKYNCQHSLYVM